jgi:hypothetical protein
MGVACCSAASVSSHRSGVSSLDSAFLRSSTVSTTAPARSPSSRRAVATSASSDADVSGSADTSANDAVRR